MNLDTTIFTCDDPAVVEAYLAHAQLERDLLNLAVEESKDRWRRLPMISRGTTRNNVLGLAIREYDWSYEESYERYKAENPDAWGFSPDRFEPVVIPDGWRRRVKDDYLSPPLKKTRTGWTGTQDDAEAARDYCRRWSQVETPRGYVERVHGAPHMHFAGLSLITIGLDVKEDKLWVIAGKGYEVKDERFVSTPLSEYVAMRERNPSTEEDEDE